jgi:hypothetical protein
MAHRMLGAVDQAADDCRRKLRAPNPAKVAEGVDVDSSELVNGRVDPGVQCSSQCVHVTVVQFLAFRTKRDELLVGQRLAARVREEAVNDGGDVSDVKCGCRHTGRAGVPLGFRQVGGQLVDAFANLKENVRDGLKDGGDAIDRAALPPLSIRHGRSSRA